MKKPDAALDYAQKLVALSDTPEFTQVKMETLLLIGFVHVDREQSIQAVDAFEPTLPYLEQSPNKDQLSLVLGVMAFGYMEAGQI